MIDVDDEVARRQPLEDVARDDPPEGPRPADADRPEQLAVGDEGEAVRAAGEPAVEAALDEGDGARRWRLLDALDDRDRVAGLARGCSARRGAWSEASTIRAPSVAPAVDGVGEAGRPAERQDRLAPAEQVARATAPPRAIAASSGGSDSQVSSSVRDATSRLFQSRGGR